MVQVQAASRVSRAASARERTWTIAAVALGGLALLQFGGRVILWFWPYQLGGLANEVGLFLAATLAALLLAPPLARRRALPPGRLMLCLAALLYAALSMAGLGWSVGQGLGFGVQSYALFSTPNCEFAARFDAPPQLGRFREGTFETDRPSVAATANLAILADLRTFNSYRAECRTSIAENGALNAPVALAAAAQWAQDIGVKIAVQRSMRDARGEAFQIEGELGGSILPEQNGKRARTLVALRSYIGTRSIMTVYVFQPQGDVLSAESMAFLDGVRGR